MQQERHWHRSRAISSRVDSHLCADSLGPHPGKRHWPTAVSFLVASFIPRCHVITWPPRDRFQPISGLDNRNFLGSLEFSIRRTCPNHRMRVPSIIWSNLLDCFWTPNIRWRTSLLLNISLWKPTFQKPFVVVIVISSWQTSRNYYEWKSFNPNILFYCAWFGKFAIKIKLMNFIFTQFPDLFCSWNFQVFYLNKKSGLNQKSHSNIASDRKVQGWTC